MQEGEAEGGAEEKMDVSRVEAEHFPPGRGIGWSRPGDFILVRGTSWRSTLISLCERLRFRAPEERHCSYWSHAALVVGTNGAIVEAGTAGVVVQRIDKYRDADYIYVAIGAEPTQRWCAVRFAASRVGCSYSLLAIAALAAPTLTRGRLRLNDSERDSCGSLVARALACTGEMFERLPAEMLPADLAKHYRVSSPAECNLGAWPNLRRAYSKYPNLPTAPKALGFDEIIVPANSLCIGAPASVRPVCEDSSCCAERST